MKNNFINWYQKFAHHRPSWDKNEENNSSEKRKGMFDFSLLCCGTPADEAGRKKRKKCQENCQPFPR